MDCSIIITNYNYGKYLSRCIRSAINQNFARESFEVLVVDDNSSKKDNSMQILNELSNNIKVIRNDKNMGLVKSCNMAVKMVSGTYTYFLDADDYLNENALLIPYLFLVNNKNHINACSCDYLEIDENENILQRRNGNAYPIRCGIMFKTDDMLKFGLYLDVPREDIDLRNRFTKSGKFIYNISIPLYRYQQHGSSLTKNL